VSRIPFILCAVFLLLPSLAEASSLRASSDRSATPPALYSQANCKMLVPANRCDLDQNGRDDRHKNICRDMGRGEFDSPDAVEVRGRNCFTLMQASGNAACAGCKEVAARAAAQPAPSPESRPASVPARPPGSTASPAKETASDRDAPPRKTAECGGAESCQRQSVEEQRQALAAARERRREYYRSMRAARESRTSTITSAATILDNWKQAIDRNPQATPAQKARYESDLKIFQQAQASLDNPKASFTEEEAKKISDPGLREDLSLFAEADQLDRSLEQEDQRLKADEEKYEALAHQSENRAGALNHIAGQGFAEQASANSQATISAPAASLAGGLRVEEAGGASLYLEAGLNSKKNRGKISFSAPAAGTGEPGARAPSHSQTLRNALRKRLQADGESDVKGRDKDAFEGDAFNKGLNKGGVSLAGEKPEKAHMAQELLSEARFWNKGAISSSAADVQATIEGFEREIASVTGLLGMETASLFDRVRAAHRSCVARDCVNPVKP